MKTIVIAATLIISATAANAQAGSQPQGGTMPNADMAAASKVGDPTVKPKGQIILLKNATDRKQVGIRAHCSNGTVYWAPKIEEDLYYCEAKDAPAPAAQ